MILLGIAIIVEKYLLSRLKMRPSMLSFLALRVVRDGSEITLLFQSLCVCWHFPLQHFLVFMISLLCIFDILTMIYQKEIRLWSYLFGFINFSCVCMSIFPLSLGKSQLHE